ncbi:ribonuclease 3-like protein 2 [Iris pallida]|uniref:Ribonuclease 3-like protein 2 n=1 Tax=Iris pallida TaxID=29817 RepID=A0AAX6FTY2_IRIPA|nr:ribonuclease 3-like protein 2 [Iris pallida]
MKKSRGSRASSISSPCPSLPPLPPPPSTPMSSDEDPMPAAVAEVEDLLGYRFSDASLIAEALTHSSDAEHASYQRLEFVGDAALGLAFTNYFYLTNPSLGPGQLSVLRAANISTEKLARVAVRHGLYRFLRRNSPKLDQMVEEFTMVVKREIEEDFDGLPYGGSLVKAPKVLADVVESIAAAVYVDCGFNLEKLWKVFRGILEPIITVGTWDEQPVTSLYEYCQKKGKSVDFKNWRKGSLNITNVFVDGELLGIGSSEQKLIAKLNAARDALLNLSSSEPIEMETDANMCSSLANGAREEKDCSKQKLYELCTKKHWPKPVYRIEKDEGPSHDKKFICSVRVVTSEEDYIAVGDLKSRVKDSESSAASKMLCQISIQ